MKHLNKKTLIRGAGKGAPKPEPAILNPPKMGGFKSIASSSVAEILDLISDGPIKGLVDQNGTVLNSDIFKGIYLDNTPIQNTLISSSSESYGTLSVDEIVKSFSNFYITTDQKYKYYQGLQNANDFAYYEGKWHKELGVFLLINYNAPIPYSDYKPPPSTFRTIFPLGQASAAKEEFLYLLNDKKYWTLASNQLEIHHVSPVSFPIFSEFEKYVQTIAAKNSGKESEIARNNIIEITKFKKFANEANYVKNTFTMYNAPQNTGFVVIKFSGKIFNNKLSADTSIEYKVNNLSDKFDYISVFVQPEISNNEYTGNATGIAIISIPLKSIASTRGVSHVVPQDLIEALSFNKIEIVAQPSGAYSIIPKNEKFNFSNVSCAFRKGEEFQSSIQGFDKILNDYNYDSRLLGPFKKQAKIQRIEIVNGDRSFAQGIRNLNLTVENSSLLEGQEGSVDTRNADGVKNYSDWNDSNEPVDYESLSVTHTIENPFVEKVSVSIVINALSDTIEISKSKVAGVSGGTLEAGSKIPSIVALRIETGKIINGQKKQVSQYSYSIVGLIQGAAIIDFGSEFAGSDALLKDTVKLIDKNNLLDVDLNQPFNIPPLEDGENPSTVKRYIKVVKLSSETNSVLINKDISLGKVTEIIDQKLSYPFSAIVGIKMDAKAFSSIPERSYDCKLKKVKIPTNYKVIDNSTGKDIRYVKNASEYVNKKIYTEDWDGTFTEEWTDNPAWILYDLLTSKRYGLGAYIDESQVNKWELYKIARFCDAVDDEGYFIGVSDGVGGLEPRFSCNILFKEQTKVYDAINIIANLFRGIVFFSGSEIHFLDDRPRTPIALFNNANVKDGIFNYSNIRRDLQFNTVEVVFLDRFDNYKTKVEYVQDEQDIRKRGVFKTTINTSGVTSRAMARRIGQHIIYQTTKENQSVDFAAGLEALLCRPGDLIVIEDEMKTRSSNYGRVLDVDLPNKKLRIDNQFISGQYTGFITLYTPTGYSASSELDQIATNNRQRVEQFSITGDFFNNNIYSGLRGTYKFSGYTQGFNNSTIYPSQFPAYTGTGSVGQKLFCYYNTGATGFVFATGLAFQNNNIYDKIITNTGIFFGADISVLAIGNSGNYTGFAYDSGAANKRGATSGQISGAIDWNSRLYPIMDGILDNEIDTYNISQITKISLTGYDNTVDYGSVISLNQNDPNVSFLAAVKPGSVYRIERTAASDQIYKIIAIRENSQNEYAVTASRYDTGKFETIEKAITQDFLENTYYTGVITVGNTQVKQLATPTIAAFSGLDQTTNNFKLTGRWVSGESYVTGYSVSISNSLAGYFESTTTNQTGIGFTGLTNIGNWTLSVTALAASPYINSSTATTGTFVAYTGANTTSITKPAVVGFSLQ